MTDRYPLARPPSASRNSRHTNPAQGPVPSALTNLFDENPITGLYVTDQSSGNFTNIFTLEPRRYGLTAGFKF